MLGRDLQWVLGADYRREAGSLVPDPLDAYEANRFRSTPEVKGALRRTRIVRRSAGASAARSAMGAGHGAEHWPALVGLHLFEGQTTWQAGLRWQPAEELSLRASYSEVFRAPSLAELYQPAVTVEQFGPSIHAGMIRRPRNRRTVRPTAFRVAHMYRTIGESERSWR